MRDEPQYRLVIESLEVLVPAHEAEDILEDALKMAARDGVPRPAEGLRAFLEGHLIDAIEARLGVESAERYADSIDLVMRAAAAEQQSAPAPSRGARGQLVLVASSDHDRVKVIAEALAHHADVEAIDDAGGLRAILWAQLATLVVVDWGHSPLDGDVIQDLAASMPATRIMLWGAPPEVEQAFVAATRGGSGSWLTCSGRASPSHVAGMVLALLGGS
jgi:hypothetical protein